MDYKSIEELIADKEEQFGHPLTEHQKGILRDYWMRGDKENMKDYIPEDEGEEMELPTNEY